MQHPGAFNRINMVFSYFLQYIRCCTAVIHTYLKYSDTSIQTNKTSSYLENNCSGGGNLSVLWLQITFYGLVRTITLEFFFRFTLKCLSIGTPKTINFPFVPNGKLMVFRCPNI